MLQSTHRRSSAMFFAIGTALTMGCAGGSPGYSEASTSPSPSQHEAVPTDEVEVRERARPEPKDSAAGESTPTPGRRTTETERIPAQRGRGAGATVPQGQTGRTGATDSTGQGRGTSATIPPGQERGNSANVPNGRGRGTTATVPPGQAGRTGAADSTGQGRGTGARVPPGQAGRTGVTDSTGQGRGTGARVPPGQDGRQGSASSSGQGRGTGARVPPGRNRGGAAVPVRGRGGNDAEAPERSGRLWSYAGSNGPSRWAALSEEFASCGTGREQSPIDLGSSRGRRVGQLDFSYSRSNLSVENDGYSIRVHNIGNSVMQIDRKRYQLRQYHFHTPAEHTIDGRRAGAELHLVHTDPTGKVFVAVLIELGAHNPAFDPILRQLPVQSGERKLYADVFVDPSSFLPLDRGYYYYTGSLTTPPCTEGVSWYVLQQPITMSAEQFAQLTSIVGGNSRPAQPLNGRRVFTSR